MIKILYAEDDVIQAKMCIDYLEKAGYQVFHAADGAQALSLYQKESPDLILMDVVMPQMTGFEVAKIIRRENVSIPILFISSLPGGQCAIDGFHSGADDYIRKEVLLEEVVLRIERCLKNVEPQKDEMDFLVITDGVWFDPVRRNLTKDNEVYQLTPIEARILKALCVNKNQFLDKEYLLREGWGNGFEESYRYLDKVISRLRKYFPKNAEAAILTSWGKGFGLIIKKKKKKGA